MDTEREFPFRAFISLEARVDRRERFFPRLREAGFDAEWFKPNEPGRLNGDSRGFASLGKRSLALTKRRILREAGRRGAGAALIIEDDAVFAPEFIARTDEITLPEDWGIFNFGCQHIETPHRVTPVIVRVARALDGHAFAVRRPFYAIVRARMRGLAKRAGGCLHSDVLLSSLHRQIPTYAAFPNLAWQAVDRSDLSGITYSNYDPDGSQRRFRHVVRPLLPVSD